MVARTGTRRSARLVGRLAAAVLGGVLLLTAAGCGGDEGGSPSSPDALKAKPSVSAGAGELTKLNVTTLVKGDGPAVTAGQTVTVNYVGVSYRTGAEFDSSWKRQQPFSFQVGQGRVIPGWDQGLVGVKVGSRVQLDIPADMAYGEDATGGRPAGPLRFVVDVLSAQ